jgi:AmiR/NasT family two-component response regulator
MYNWQNRRVTLIHPEDADREYLLNQLRALKAEVSAAWPTPETIDLSADALIIRVVPENELNAALLLEEFSGICVAIIEPGHRRLIRMLTGCNVHGLIIRPYKQGAFTLQMAMAAAIYGRMAKQQVRIIHLEENLRSRRAIEKATRYLEASCGVSEDDAYEALRKTAMAQRMHISALAEYVTVHPDRQWSLLFSDLNSDDLTALGPPR